MDTGIYFICCYTDFCTPKSWKCHYNKFSLGYQQRYLYRLGIFPCNIIRKHLIVKKKRSASLIQIFYPFCPDFLWIEVKSLCWFFTLYAFGHLRHHCSEKSSQRCMRKLHAGDLALRNQMFRPQFSSITLQCFIDVSKCVPVLRTYYLFMSLEKLHII